MDAKPTLFLLGVLVGCGSSEADDGDKKNAHEEAAEQGRGQEAEPSDEEGPLIVSNQLRPSFARIEMLAHEDLVQLLRSEVEDDTIDERLDEPTEALWQLMSFAAQGAGDIDWETAKELDNETLALISNGGTFFRGQPFRLGICQNRGIWTEAAGENSMRLDRLSRGWLGNLTWKDSAPVVQFISPIDLGELQDHQTNRLVTGRAFFLRNVRYPQKDGKSTAMAPLFVVAELEHFIPAAARPEVRYYLIADT